MDKFFPQPSKIGGCAAQINRKAVDSADIIIAYFPQKRKGNALRLDKGTAACDNKYNGF